MSSANVGGQEPRESRILHTLFTRQLDALAAGKPETFDVRTVEFDDVQYHVLANPREDESRIALSLAAPNASLPEGAVEDVRAHLKASSLAGAVEEAAPERGFQLTLHCDLSRFPTAEPQRSAAIAAVASIRAAAMGAPVRRALARLQDGTSSNDSVSTVCHRTGEAYFVCPKTDAVTFVFPVRCRDNADATIACNFLQAFGERRGLRHGAPPSRWDREPPLELRSCDPKLANGANGGYVSFTLERRHVDNGRLESAVWSTICFPAYASRHIKCSKAFFHSRMRRRTDTLLNVLNQAKPEKKDREKKTASGRTFVRQV